MLWLHIVTWKACVSCPVRRYTASVGSEKVSTLFDARCNHEVYKKVTKIRIGLRGILQSRVVYFLLVGLLAHSCQQYRNGRRRYPSLVRFWTSGCRSKKNGSTWEKYSQEEISDSNFQMQPGNSTTSTRHFKRCFICINCDNYDVLKVKYTKQRKTWLIN